MKWEYFTWFGPSFNVDMLDEYGEGGWELVAFMPQRQEWVLVFKRPKAKEVQP